MTFDLKDILVWLIPVLISVAAITVARRAVTRSLRPVLVFVRRGTDRVWFIENVGTGPALDVVVAEQDWDEKKWRRSLLLPPIAKDGQLRLRSAPSVFGVIYTDAEGNRYSTICSGYWNRFRKCHVFDKPADNEIVLYADLLQ